jgi:hypothetical protein
MSHNIFENGLGYEGKVTLTLKSNNRVIKSQTYKNKGTAQLFKFLGYCLIGRYSEVENLLPTKIALLYNAAATPEDADPGDVVAVSDFFGTTQTLVSSTDNPAEVKVTHSFEISRAQIHGNFNQIALYGDGITKEDDSGNFSAYYYLTDSTRNKFDVQKISEWSSTTVLLIDWELSLSNKNIGTADN